jgi:hypothetical protein
MVNDMLSDLLGTDATIEDAINYVSKVNKLNLGIYELVDGKDYPYRIELQKKSAISERRTELPLIDLPQNAIKGEWDDAFLKQLETYLKQNAADIYVQGIIKKEQPQP